jgi:signal transduction histidine kinase
MLTALRMELGRVERSRMWDAASRAVALAESKKLTETMVRTVRDLALGLRPSMLDDLGLKPALEWHARDFSRRYGVPIDLTVEGDLTSLPEPHRTCVYRVIQEALTNCARHSSAKHIEVTVRGGERLVDVSVSDDGVGMDETRKTRGLGLLGIGERVREIDGTFSIESRGGAGTRLRISIPVAAREPEVVNLANTAG